MEVKSILKSAVFGLAALVSVNASALTLGYDSYNDAAGGDSWEIYSMGYSIAGGNLNISINTGYNFAAPVSGGTTYSSSTPISAGDILIVKNGSYLAGTGQRFGLGVTSHSGQISDDPNEAVYPWLAVVAGNLYKDATFATGSYEGYPGATGFGADPFGHGNNIPTLIADYAANLGAQSISITPLNGGGAVMVNPDGTMKSGVWNISASISLSALGLGDGDSFEFWWAPECGNDQFSMTGSVPEPMTLSLLGVGLLGAGRLRRRMVA